MTDPATAEAATGSPTASPDVAPAPGAPARPPGGTRPGPDPRPHPRTTGAEGTPHAPADGARGRTFAALADPTYRLLWLGGLVGFLAVQMEFIARGWLAYDLTGTNKGLGLVYLGFGVPMLLLTPWGGVAADRLAKRKVLLACQLALAASSAVVALSLTFDFVSYPLLVATAVVQGAGFSFLGPARMAFTGALVGPSRLANAVVLQQMSMNGTRIFGPSLAGAMIGIAAVGIGGVYYLTTALTLVAVGMTVRLPPGHADPSRPARSPLGEMADGVRYVLHRPMLRLLVGTSFLVVMFAFPYVAFLPTLAEETLGVGPGGYGVLSGASAVGALAASLFIASRADGPRAWRLQTAAGLGFGLGVAVLGFSPNFAAGLAIILFVGAASSAFQSLNNSIVLGLTDGAYHGRVQSLMMLSFSAFGMVALPLGALADAFGLERTMLGMGVVAAAAVAGYSVLRRQPSRHERG